MRHHSAITPCWGRCLLVPVSGHACSCHVQDDSMQQQRMFSFGRCTHRQESPVTSKKIGTCSGLTMLMAMYRYKPGLQWQSPTPSPGEVKASGETCDIHCITFTTGHVLHVSSKLHLMMHLAVRKCPQTILPHHEQSFSCCKPSHGRQTAV